MQRDDLVAEYLFNGSAADTSGHAHHGTVHGATPCPDRFGKPNSAYHFDGTDDYIIVSPPPPLNPDALSVSAWVRYDPQPLEEEWSNCIICQDNGDDEDQSRRVFQLSTSGNHIKWHRMIRARDPFFKRRIRPNTWYHVAAVYENGVHRLYVDGVLHDTVRHTLWTHPHEPLYMGRKGTPEPYFFFRGAIDDVRIYNRALSVEDIDALFHERGFQQSDPDPIAASSDPISGKWGRHGDVVLDLKFDGVRAVSGQVMNGRPDNMAPISNGTFDRDTRALRLEGEAKRPDSGAMAPYLVYGMLDDDQLVVTATFGTYEGDHTLTKAGARRQWWKHSRLRARLQGVTIRTSRFVFGLSRPTKAANARRLRERGETLDVLLIRDATPEDIPALSKLHVTAWNATYNPMGIKGPDVAIRERQWREQFAKDHRRWFCLVAETPNAGLVGFAHGRLDDEGAGELNKIYLLTEYQRLGLGRRLVGHVARRYLNLGVRAMGLYVDPRNPSCAFYERLGAQQPRDARGNVNHSWYNWPDLEALAAACPVE